MSIPDNHLSSLQTKSLSTEQTDNPGNHLYRTNPGETYVSEIVMTFIANGLLS